MVTIDELEKKLNGEVGDEVRSLKVAIVRNNIEEELEPMYSCFALEGNDLDEIFCQKVALRAANILLKGTEFEKIPWEIYSEIKVSTGDYAYIKRIDNCNYAYLYLDYFYHT